MKRTLLKVLIWLAGMTLCSAGAPRKTLGDYALKGSNADFDIGVDYTVHSYAGNSEDSGGQMYLARDFLVFEVAIFPKHPIQVNEGAFELTVNNSKVPIPQVQPQFVAADVRQPEWSTHPQFEAGAGVGDAGVTLGRPQRVERFPGDPTAQSRLPRPPHVPEDDKAAKPVVDPGQLAIDSALLTGTVSTPRSGNVYFPYRGNAAKIKHLVLHFSTGPQNVDLIVR